jgi:glyoxylase I family protein
MGCTNDISTFILEHFLKINKIDHVSINVLDMVKSVDFYARVLGLEQLQTVDCGDFDITYFALPDGSRLELFDYHGKSPVNQHQESEAGLRHIAFQVEDVAEHEKLLRAEGIPITLPACDLPDLGVRVLLFLDPNSVTLEFCEKL